MKIAVCVKQVAIVTGRSGVDPASNRLLPGEMVHALNPFDEVAVEEALKIRETHGGTVTVATLGPPRAEDALRWCLAMGADEAIHILEEDAADPWSVSNVLAALLRDAGYDLILCGRVAIDDEWGQTGTLLAVSLGIPVVTCVTAVECHPAEGRAELRRSLDRGDREIVECPLPAVFTVERTMNRPRYPTLAGRREAGRRGIRRIDPAHLPERFPSGSNLPAFDVVRLAPPKIRPKKILAPGDEVTAAGRMQWILSGGVGKKGGGRITGDAGTLADGIIRFLAERSLISGAD